MELTALMSVYNGERFIKETIDSILNQSYTDFELLIIDDASTDNTVKIIESINDNRIILIKLKENVGVGQALKIGVESINSKYVIKVDSDDINHKDRFFLQKKFMDDNPNIDLGKCDISFFPDNAEVRDGKRYSYMKNCCEKLYNYPKSSEEIEKYLYHWICIPHNSMIIKTDVIKKNNYKSLRYAEDDELFYRLNKKGYKMGLIKDKLVEFRVRNDSLVATSSKGSFLNRYKMKYEELANFFKDSNRCYVWGTGLLAETFTECIDFELNIVGFIDGRIEDKEEEFLNRKVYSKNILENDKVKVIIAAQPAILSAMEYLNSIGYKINKDYYIY